MGVRLAGDTYIGGAGLARAHWQWVGAGFLYPVIAALLGTELLDQLCWDVSCRVRLTVPASYDMIQVAA